MKYIKLLTSAALVALAAPCAAQTFTWLQDVNVGGVEALPSGVVAVGPDAYLSGFGSRRIVKVSNFATAAAAPTQFYSTNSTDNPTDGYAWALNTGLTSIDYRAADQTIMVAGDTFADGTIYQVRASNGTLLRKQAANIGGSARRVAGAAFYGPTKVLGQNQAGTNYWQLNETLDSVGFFGGPNPGSSRDIAIDQVTGTAYVSFNNATPTVGVHRIIDAGTAFDIAGNTNEANWYSATPIAAGGTIQGIGLGTIGATQYALLSLRNDDQVRLIPTTATGVNANPAAVITVPDGSGSGTNNSTADATVATIGASQYLLVVQYGTPNVLSVYGVNGATLQNAAVNDWELY